MMKTKSLATTYVNERIYIPKMFPSGHINRCFSDKFIDHLRGFFMCCQSMDENSENFMIPKIESMSIVSKEEGSLYFVNITGCITLFCQERNDKKEPEINENFISRLITAAIHSFSLTLQYIPCQQ